MSLSLLVLWAGAVTSFTLLGSLYARRFAQADLLIGLYVAFILTAQILAAKIAVFDLGSLGAFTAPAGVLVFSVTFLLTDIVNERFGRKETQRMIFIAFVSQVAMAFFIWLGAQFASDPMWAVQGAAWNRLFLLIPQITFASWIAFLISENVDAYIYAWFKKITHDKHLWLRNVFSTIPALALDSVIFVPIAFWGIPTEVMLAIIYGQIAVKWIVGIVNIPFMYLNHAILMKGKHAGDEHLWQAR